MTIHLLRSPEYDLKDFNEVLGLLTTHSKSIKFKGHSKVDIKYKDVSYVKHWDVLFEICQNYRTKKKISEDDYIFLLTEYKNTEDYFGWTDESLGNYFIQTSDWNQYFSAEVNKHFPISYEVVAWILRSLMYDTQEELLKNAHISARGCVMDFCDEKEDIILKMRTGDVCNECLKRISDRGVNPVFLGNIFNTMENIRKGLMYRERNELLGMVSPIRINLRLDNPKFVFTEMNNLELKLDTAQTAIYLTIIQLGGLRTKCLVDYEDELLNNYLLVKDVPVFENPYRPIVKEWINPMNTSLFTQKVSKINKKIKDLLGEKLATPYLIINEKGKYKVNLSNNKVHIE
jgi:hypothetical protein